MNRLFRKKGGFTLIELMIVVAIIGILAAIAIPNFIRFQAKSKQSEAKTNLKSIFTAEKSFFGEKDRFVENFIAVGFDPEPGNRYNYNVGQTACATPTPADQTSRKAASVLGCIPQDSTKFPTAVTGGAPFAKKGVDGTCPSCNFFASATGNIDNDAAADTWGITSNISSAGEALTNTCGIDAPGTVTGGEPGNAYNDVGCD
ncbi:prepilin-type N-terminal cleavage/methylation domain-containing protein [Corallococcus exercitus]|uniref:Prepilin-type N-terminal cleavage/methylation domain-containing protein n=2 Tax=Corallococcus exercitus TaxID=2316736 RepID=A0A7Y4JZ85_9BACT|nr:prepilin-type N-terminal cleavage/methylation domain-containing protein [Corallococcus exercitus]